MVIVQAFARFFENLQLDLKAFIYWCLVLTLFRIGFIAVYSGQLAGVYAEVPLTLWLGVRLSFKTAGIVCLLGFVIATLPKIALPSWPAAKIRLMWHTAALIFFSILFMARIPYYGIFNAAFNIMLINGAHDDIYAIIVTAVKEYQLLWRLPAAILLGVFLSIPLKFFLRTAVLQFASVHHKLPTAVFTMVALPILWIFVRYGGAMSYAASINWESAARLKSNLLNEAVLDDGQALYRVYSIKKILGKINNVDISEKELRGFIAKAGGNAKASTIDEAFLRTVSKPRLQRQSSNVVLIVGESFGVWPFLPKFKDLGLVENMLALQNSAQAAHIATMLPHSGGTIGAVNGLLTGLADTHLYENYQPNSFQNQYASGIGYIMRRLGYKTVFWYGGFPGWQNIKNFALAQSFDEFYCADEIGYKGGNAWGCPDDLLLKSVAGYIEQEAPQQKVFHLVLTTSNHPPYTLDVDGMGFPRAVVRSKLPADIANDERTLTELGHIWYADKTVGDFVRQAQALRPDSLFVITGDHSERFDFAIEQDIRTMSVIPCIFYGQGVQSEWFGDKSVGCHMQLAGTLAEMLAPNGFTYTSILPSMFTGGQLVFNHRLYAQGDVLSAINRNDKDTWNYFDARRRVGAWRVLKGNGIE